MLNEEAWIVEGCSFSTFEMRFTKAYILIYFHFSRLICFLLLFKRIFNYEKDFGGLRAVTREIMKYTWNFDKEKRARIEELRQKYNQTEFLIFRSQKDVFEILYKPLMTIPTRPKIYLLRKIVFSFESFYPQ